MKVGLLIGNLCIRCGKQRIVIRTWKESEGSSLLTYTQTACPDEECQKAVDKLLAAQVEKREALKRNWEQKIASLKTKKDTA